MADDFTKEVRELWSFANEADRENREEAIEDLKFAAGEQWDETVRNYRESSGPFPLPCLTINTLPQFVGQVIGDRRANETAVKVLPRENGDVKIAEIRSELIRSIELQSKADRVYAMAFEQAVTCGIGNFRIDIDYAYEDAFERDLFVNAIPNPLAVRWDPLSADPTARDAGWCFVGDEMSEREYERRFPKAAKPSMFDSEACAQGWFADGKVIVPEYWRIVEKERTLLLTADGKTVDVTGQDRAKWPQPFIGDDGQPVIRDKAKCKYAVMVLTNGMEALSDEYELKLHRLPIIRVMGREVWTGEKRVRYGLVRFARDPQRLKNYWRSVVAELLMRAPRANFIASADAVKGREADWPNTLIYGNGEQPHEITTNSLAALLNEAQMCAQDMKETTGIHEAELGMRSNETSGIAIARRQQQGDIATLMFNYNMNAAEQEGGEVINALIPIVCDTPRTIRTVGADMATKMLRVNDPNADEHIDLSLGKYDVTITTGPAYQTRRIEASANMMQAVQAWPDFMKIAGDKIAIAQDWPDSEEIAERVKRTMDPAILGPDADDGKDPQQLAQEQQRREEAAQKQQMAEQLAMRKAIAEAEEAEARALKAKEEARQIASGRKLEIDGYNAETNRIRAITAKDFPLPAEAQAILAPIVTQAVMNVLQSPDVLPMAAQIEIAASSLARSDEEDAARAAAALQQQQTPDEGLAQ